MHIMTIDEIFSPLPAIPTAQILHFGRWRWEPESLALVLYDDVLMIT